MQFANYAEFRLAVLKMIDGDNVGTSFSLETLDLLIALGEAAVYSGPTDVRGRQLDGLRASSMQTALTGNTASNAVTIPADCLELEIVWFDPEKPIEIVPESDLRKRLPCSFGADARQCAQAGDSLIFLPEVADAQAIGGRYYQRPADIKTVLHATFNRYPEVYLFAALAESAPFLGEDVRVPMWKTLLAEKLEGANKIERARVFAGSRLTQKVR